MMELIVSNKNLAQTLKKFDLDNDEIVRANTQDGKLWLLSNRHTEGIDVSIIDYQASIPQNGRRWDFVLRTLERVEEQPTVIEITPKRVRVSFDY